MTTGRRNISTYWRIQCLDCPADDEYSSTEGVNWGNEMFARWLQAADAIVAFSQTPAAGDIDGVRVLSYSYGPDLFWWIVSHYKHNVQIVSEYGDVYDWQASQPVTRGAASGQAQEDG